MSCGRLNASWKISSSAVDGQSFLYSSGVLVSTTVKRGVLRLQTMRPKLPQDVDEDKGDRRLMVYERKRKG